MVMRKTKIVCTLGPATNNEEKIRQLMLNGMDVARMNFSHGDHASHLATLNIIKKVREELNLPVAALLDTKGPEIRVCKFKNDRIELHTGDTFTLTTRDIEGTQDIVSITYKNLINDVQVGGRILIDDGLIELSVIKKTDTDIICRALNNGAVSNNKGVNVPDCHLTMPYISQKDYDDIVFAVENDYDFIAASFVRNAQDVLDIRKILEDHNGTDIKIISKIENMQGVQNIDEIIRVSDGIMVARGDMGVEIPFEDVPVLQKMIIKKVYEAGKVVITATQMLDSMMKNPRPTRAEATDVANAIYDGTSAIMLSGETAAGLYPIEAVQTMVKIAESTEASINYRKRFKERTTLVNPDITNAISHACCTTAMDLNASAILSVTKSGFTARMVSKYRPECAVVACVMNKKAYRQLNLSWGVTPIMMMMNAFLDDERVNLYGYEAGGNGPESGKHAIRFAPGTGQLGMFQGAKSYLLETDEGQTLDTYSISAGLDYASVGPEHAWLKDIGRVNYSWATDEEAMNAFRDLSQTEGIIPAIESSHAVAGAYKAAADLKAKGYDKAVMIVNISGRGDKDMATAGKWFGYLTDDQAAALDVTGTHGNTVA